MRKYYFNIILKYSPFILLAFSIIGCKDVFEKNITGKKVITILPSGEDTLFTNQVSFKWEKMEGATLYRLQIVSQTFDDLQVFHLDSLIEGEDFQLILNPGQYEYRLRGENFAYQSDYTNPVNIYIDSVNDLNGQFVQILSPSPNYYTNQISLTDFLWQNIFSASYYTFQLRNGSDFNVGSLIHEEPSIYGTSFNFSQSTSIALPEGVYSWGIKAVNQSSNSAFSTRVFYIDTTAPNVPVLTFPMNNYINAGSDITLKWNKGGVDPGIVNSAISTTIEMSSGDSLFNVNNVTVYTNLFADSLEIQSMNSGIYWWRGYLKDEAGNVSAFYSLENKFTIP